MIEVTVKMVPLALSLLSCSLNSAAKDVGEKQFACNSTEHCYPFIALLMNLHGIYTAAILSPKWMVSSAYCCMKPGGRTFLAYAGSGDLTTGERLQVRCAEAVKWVEPASGTVTEEASERSAVALLLTTAPWTTTEAVRPVAVGQIDLSPSVLRNCIAAGFHLDKSLVVKSLRSNEHWFEGEQVCILSDSSGTLAMVPGSLFYCYGPDIVIGVGVTNSDSTQNARDGRLTTPGLCFAYLGGFLLTSLLEIVGNHSTADDLRVRLPPRAHLNEANHVDTFIPAVRTVIQASTKSSLGPSTVNEYQENVGKSSLLVKRDFNLSVFQNEKDKVLAHPRYYTTTPPEALWSLALVPVVACYLLVTYWTSLRKQVRRLYMYARRQNGSHSYECI